MSNKLQDSTGPQRRHFKNFFKASDSYQKVFPNWKTFTYISSSLFLLFLLNFKRSTCIIYTSLYLEHLPTQQESLEMLQLQEFPEPVPSRPVSSLREPDHLGICSEEFLVHPAVAIIPLQVSLYGHVHAVGRKPPWLHILSVLEAPRRENATV